jgi:hypothetical protein
LHFGHIRLILRAYSICLQKNAHLLISDQSRRKMNTTSIQRYDNLFQTHLIRQTKIPYALYSAKKFHQIRRTDNLRREHVLCLRQFA